MLSAAISANPHTDKWFHSDDRFHLLYPASMQSLACEHWTPLEAVRKAAAFLAAEKNARILDIGSGVGKFCLGAANCMPEAFYTGIEQRKTLVEHAENTRSNLGFKNIEFIHGNFTQLDFSDYDHFYFFNSFYENLRSTNKIDSSIGHSHELYHFYTHYLLEQLKQKPAGTRLATYFSQEDEIPNNFLTVGSEMDDHLKFWIKI